MKAKGMKRIISLLLSTLLLISAVAFTVSAAEITVKVDGEAYVPGAKICAVSVVELTLPEAVGNLGAVTFWELSKIPTTSGGTDYPWYKRNFDGVLSADKQTLTVTFTRGDISSNSTYKFEVETNSASDGAEYSFTFSTKPEVDSDGHTIYFAENFSRYRWTMGREQNFSATLPDGNTMPHNLDPVRKGYGYTGFAGAADYVGSYAAILDDTTQITGGARGRVLRTFANATQLINFGINPQYSAVVNSLQHVGKLTVTFETLALNQHLGFAGLWIAQSEDATTGKVTWSVYGETTCHATNSYYAAFNAANCQLLTTKVFDSSADVLLKKHTISLLTEATQTQAGVSTRTLAEVTLNGETIWKQGPDGYFTFAASQAGDDGKGTPWQSSLTTPITRSNLVANDNGQIFIYYMEYKDHNYKGVASISVDDDPQTKIDSAITVQFDDTPTAAEIAELTNKIKINDGAVAWSTAGYNSTYNNIVLEPTQPLAHNTEYTVTVPSLNYTIIGSGAAKEYTFTTGWEQLTSEVADTVDITSAPGASGTTFTLDLSANDAVAVENITSATCNYKTVLALYREENGFTRMVDSAMTQQSALNAGVSTAISAGSVSYTDEELTGATRYFAKLFLVAGDAQAAVAGAETLAEAITFGETVTAPAITASVSGTGYVAADVTADRGRVDGYGEAVGAKRERALWVTLAETVSGDIVYFDQVTNDENNQFTFGCNVVPNTGGATIPEDYTITVKPSGLTALTDDIVIGFSNVNPYVVTVSISGNPQYRDTLTATYELDDFFDRTDVNNETVVEWWISPSATGTYTKVATGTDFLIGADHIGKFAKCIVIPKVVGSGFGDAFDSSEDGMYPIAPMYLKSAPEVASATLAQQSNSNQIDLTFSVVDPINHELGVHTVVWTFKNAAGTVVKTLSGTPATITYIAEESDDGLKVSAEVTPCIVLETCGAGEACGDIEYGVPVTTNELTIDYYTRNSGGSSSGGGGGFGGVSIGGGKKPEKDSAPVYFTPDEESKEGTLDLTDARGHWAEKEIFELYDKGIVNGKSEHTFDPDGKITRAEFMAILVRTMELDVATFAGEFADVAADSWYADVLATAKKNGLLAGSNGNANPDQEITREEMVQIIVRAYEMACGEIVVDGGLLDYTDVASISTWARQAVIKATEKSLVNGVGDGSFAPRANATRAQGVVMVARLIPHFEKAAKEKAAQAQKAAEESEKQNPETASVAE